jgi:2-polyprenyl-6-methoxyphenol hydroxylase-like FAD-dependent oxidoreductase
MTSGERIVVVGAGIGGLTAAIALRRAGFDVAVYERAEALRPVGAGLTIQPNAVLALRRVGVDEAVENTGAHLRAGELFRADGTQLTRLTRETSEAVTRQVGAPLVGIHRATLHGILLDALGRERVHLGRTCTGYTQGEGEVTVRFEGGEAVGATALLGADGLRSTVRRQLLGDGEPVYAGYTCWRGISPSLCGVEPDFGGEGWGPTARFGGCTIDGGRFYWFAVADAPQGDQDGPEGPKAKLLALYKGWASPVPELLTATPEEAIFRADICDRPPVGRWGDGRVTLLGGRGPCHDAQPGPGGLSGHRRCAGAGRRARPWGRPHRGAAGVRDPTDSAGQRGGHRGPEAGRRGAVAQPGRHLAAGPRPAVDAFERHRPAAPGRLEAPLLRRSVYTPVIMPKTQVISRN